VRPCHRNSLLWALVGRKFKADGKLRPPLLTDRDRWRRIFIEPPSFLALKLINGRQLYFHLAIDKAHNTPAIGWLGPNVEFVYNNAHPDILALAGTMNGHDMSVLPHWLRQPDFILTNRGFHWIGEYQSAQQLASSDE